MRANGNPAVDLQVRHGQVRAGYSNSSSNQGFRIMRDDVPLQ